MDPTQESPASPGTMQQIHRIARAEASFTTDQKKQILSAVYSAPGPFQFAQLLFDISLQLNLTTQELLHMCIHEGITVAHRAAQIGRIDILDYCFHEYRENPHDLVHFLTRPAWFGDAPMHVATENGHLAFLEMVVSKLLQLGVNVSIHEPGACDNTPLHYAIKRRHFEIARRLINAQPDDLNRQNSSGNTPLHLCAEHDALYVAGELLRFGAATHIRNALRQTPGDVATFKKNSVYFWFLSCNLANEKDCIPEPSSMIVTVAGGTTMTLQCKPVIVDDREICHNNFWTIQLSWALSPSHQVSEPVDRGWKKMDRGPTWAAPWDASPNPS
ncbi:ankyrin repeat-containing domain protein [Xylariaceae sp. FL1272]|nr:ankyrin repeat-containing domain protein [Xylariaceae sp. FL1272]